jgi:dTDP-4-amino-4,6-dideoxygalactose transaminase
MTGTNAKLSDVLSAIGLSQMEEINILLDNRRKLADRYRKRLDIPSIQLPQPTPNGTHSYQTFCISVKNRDKLLKSMRSREIEVQIGTYALHKHFAFNNNPLCHINGSMKNSLYAYEHSMALPLYHTLSEEDQNLVSDSLSQLL